MEKVENKDRKPCSRRALMPTIYDLWRFCHGYGMLFRRRKVQKRPDKHREPLRNAGTGRASFSSLALSASMTVEASLVLPLFIFFLAEILSIFDMLRLQSSMLAALHETGTKISEYAFYTRYGLNEWKESENESEDAVSGSAVSLIVSETYVRSSVASYLGKSRLSSTCLEGGAGGISYLQSSVLKENDLVDIAANYRIKPFLPMFGLRSFPVQTRYYGHAWVGYTRTGEETDANESGNTDEITVYVTRTGTVYHKDRNCTYLKPSIRTIPVSDLNTIRSQDGSKYYPCERCKPEGCSMVVIAKDGNRYHSSSGCTAIQRDVSELPLSEAQSTRRACSKCGGA